MTFWRKRNKPPVQPVIEPQAPAPTPLITQNTYEQLYENHAQQYDDSPAVGHGDYNVIGEIELDVLRMEGLQPAHRLVDFGCGNGRLARHAIPYLIGGEYIGIDIAPTLLEVANARIKREIPNPACKIQWLHQNTPNFALPEQSVDFLCAFSVFTHMEHEDTYQYFQAIRRILSPEGRFIFSCLPIHLSAAKHFFVEAAEVDLATRWDRVRNVVTSVDFISEIAQLAGWEILRWHDGQIPSIASESGELRALGQSVCVLKIAASA